MDSGLDECAPSMRALDPAWLKDSRWLNCALLLLPAAPALAAPALAAPALAASLKFWRSFAKVPIIRRQQRPQRAVACDGRLSCRSALMK